MSLWAEHTGVLEECFKQPENLECVRRVRYYGLGIIIIRRHGMLSIWITISNNFLSSNTWFVEFKLSQRG
jgi:hypothetical protein